jgi:hypothetical protein
MQSLKAAIGKLRFLQRLFSIFIDFSRLFGIFGWGASWAPCLAHRPQAAHKRTRDVRACCTHDIVVLDAQGTTSHTNATSAVNKKELALLELHHAELEVHTSSISCMVSL